MEERGEAYPQERRGTNWRARYWLEAIDMAAEPIPPAIIPFKPLEAYERERAYSRALEKKLDAALMLLGMECQRRELRGEDVAHVRDFIKSAVQ